MSHRLLIVVIALAAATAHAQPTDRAQQARAAADGGSALFRQKDFVGAIAQFKAAYELDPDPSYLFNVAQAYRHAGDCVNAAEFYGRFLAEVPQSPNAEKVREWHESQAACAKERTAPKPAEPPPAPAPAPAPVPVPVQRERRTGLVVTLAVTSAAAFAVGGFFVWDARYLETQQAALVASCTRAAPCPVADANDYDRRGSRANALSAVGIGLGGVALAASVVVYLWSGAETVPNVSIAPVDGGATVAGSFAW